MTEDNDKKDGFFRKVARFIRNTVILALILVPCWYSVKLQIKLKDSRETADSLRLEIADSRALLDSMKLMQDNEALLRDSLDDQVDRKLDERVSAATFSIDTTTELLTARRAVEESLALDGWLDSLCAQYPEGVSAHVKLHYLDASKVREERLIHHLKTRFPEYDK